MLVVVMEGRCLLAGMATTVQYRSINAVIATTLGEAAAITRRGSSTLLPRV